MDPSTPDATQRAKRRRLVVVRDRAHAREIPAAPGVVVWTTAELLERLATWALLGDAPSGVVRDEAAPLWATAAALARGDVLLPRIAHDADDLRRAVTHGGASAAEIARALPADAAGRLDELHGLFARLADAERRLADARRVDLPHALRRAVERVEKRELPRALLAFLDVEVRHFVEPTDLELQVVVALARAGMPVRVSVPMDSLGRGLLAGAEPVLRALEEAHDAPWLEIDLVDVGADDARPLAGFQCAFYGRSSAPDAPVEVLLAADEAAEAREVASVVAAWRRANPEARIAVATRVVDAAAARLADALVAQGVPVRFHRRPLVDTPGARLLLDVVALARDGAPRDRLLAVLTSPALVRSLSSSDGARVLRVLRNSAARTDVEDAGSPRGGYRHRLERYRSSLEAAGDEAARADVDLAIEQTDRALRLASRVRASATLVEHLEALALLAGEIFDDGAGLGCKEVKELLDEAGQACRAVSRPGDGVVALPAFATLLQRALERAQGPSAVVDDDHAVEILALPEVWGRAFDHVVVADMVEGRLPRAERSERLLGDGDRIAINRAVGRRVLRLVDDDPLEPGPVARAQALEPAWMLGAIRAASTSMLLCAPRRDGRGRELAPSVFLLEAIRALGGDPGEEAGAGTKLAREPAPREVAVRAAALYAKGLLHDDNGAALPPSLRAHVALAKRMSDERARFFSSKKSPLAERRAPFAFGVDPERVARVFGDKLGIQEARPLTPTRLEALASCRMHGFVQHVLKVDVEPPAGNAADARVLGTLAHTVMERFFTERRDSGVPAAQVTESDRQRVRALLAEEAAPLLRGRATGHLGAIRAQIAWLETALVRAVSMLARDPPVRGVEPREFEVQIGARQDDRDAPLSSVPMRAGDRTLWIGGIIDRVDEGTGPDGRGARAVIDYKTASTGSIKKKAHKDALFETHFQLLLYLRLLEHHRPSAPDTSLHGYLISLRDGTTSDDVAEIDDLRARILDDTRDDGLAAGVGRVVLPILDGALPPDAGDRCETCRLQRLCRVPLAAEFAADLDDPEDGGAP